jgi:DNA-binding transcriptional ArsR family regulator
MSNNLHTFKSEFFKALAHPLRIKILEALRDSEKNVTELQTILATDQSGVSQQLAVLRSKNLITARKNGTNVYYSIRDPLIFELLEVARQIFNNHLIDTRDLLSQLENE